jgi:hypothetical protein
LEKAVELLAHAVAVKAGGGWDGHFLERNIKERRR